MSQVLLYESGAVIRVRCCYMSQVLLYESGSVYITNRIVST